MKKVKSMLKSLLSFTLALAMVFEAMPVQALAGERQDVYIDEIEIPQDVLEGDFFYLGNTQLSIPENGGGRYLFKVARGGDAATESTALVKIADLTAKFGEDYVVSVHDSNVRVDNPDENMSFIERIQGSDYVQSYLEDEETAMAEINEDEEMREAFNEGIDSAIDYISEESGLNDKYPDGYPDMSGIDETDEDSPDPQDDADEESVTDLGQVTDDDPEEVEINGVTIEDGTETLSIDDSKDTDENAVQQARSMFTGVEGSSQRLTSNAGDDQIYKDLQSIADVMTNTVVGASAELTFKEGEKEKYLEIIPKNNVRGDGDRMFYMILGAPTGSTTNSAVSTCAFTIVDDEESQPSLVSFTQEEYTHEPGAETVKVTVIREGGINKVASVKVVTADEGSALSGRDYAKVERTLFFPFGISSLDVDIPVRTMYFNGEKDFYLNLIPEGGCEAELSRTRVILEGTYGDGSALKEETETDADNADVSRDGALKEGSPEDIAEYESIPADGATLTNNLNTVKTLDEIKISKPWATGTIYDKYTGPVYGSWGSDWKGENYYDKDKRAWNLMYKNYYEFDDNVIRGAETVTYRLSQDDKPYWLSGARVTWKTGEHKDAEMCVEITGDEKEWYKKWPGRIYNDDTKSISSYKEHYLYNRVTTFGPDTDDMYPSIKDSEGTDASRPLYINFADYGNCNDCTNLWIYSIKPILRPFEFRLVNAEGLDFLKENGSMGKDDGSAEKASILDAGEKLVLFLNEGITISQPDGSNVNKYARISGLEISPDNKNWYDLGAKCTDGKSITYMLTEDNIKNFVAKMGEAAFYKACLENTTVKPFSEYAKSKPTYARLYIRPRFEKIPVKAKLHNPYDFPVTLSISGTDHVLYAGEYKDVTYYKGDTLKVSVFLDNDEAAGYVPSGVHVKFKDNAGTSHDEIINFVGGKPVYIPDTKDNRLTYAEITSLEPAVQERNNKIVIRVKTSEIKYFSRNTAGERQGLDFSKGTVNGDYTEITYADENSTVYGKVYPISVDPAFNTVCRWYDKNTGRYYEGNTLYFTAGDSADKNLITLSAANRKENVRLTGTLRYKGYDLMTKESGSVITFPAGGALVAAGSASAVADENGNFTTGDIPVSGSGDSYLRYMVTVNGRQEIGETSLKGAKGNIDITSAFGEGVSPVTSEIFRDLKITANYKDTSDYSVADGYALPIVDSEEVSFTIQIAPSEYNTTVIDENGGLKEETRVETPKTVQLFVYKSDGKIRGTYEPVTGTNKGTYYEFKSSIGFSQEDDDEEGENEQKSFSVLPGDMLFIRLGTDRGNVKDKDGNELDYTYSDLFTGYTFMFPTSYIPPVEQGATSPVNIKYKDIPFLGEAGGQLALPFATVGYTRTKEGGYRMYIGVSPVQIYDSVKGGHNSHFIGDDGQDWRQLFTAKHPFKSFKTGLDELFQSTFRDKENVMAALNPGSLGHPNMKFDILAGIFFDFKRPQTEDIYGNKVESPDFVFTGIGAYLAVSAAIKMNWYFMVPVVFIPIYIGFEVDASAMGWLGAVASGESQILLDDTKNQSVDFDTALDEFTGSAILAGTFQLKAGIGLEGMIGVKAVGRFDMVASYDHNPNLEGVDDLGAYLDLSTEIGVDAFLTTFSKSWELKDWQIGSFDDYANGTVHAITPQGSSSSENGAIESSSDGFRFRKGNGTDSAWQGNQINTELSRDSSAFAPNAEKTSILVKNSYENPEAQLITLQNGTLVLGYIDNDNSKGEFQRTTFKLATYKDDKWSEPVAVSESRTADFHPTICEMKDGKVMAAWVSTADANIDENTSTVDYLKSMEVYAAIAEIGGDGSITMDEPVKITNDHRKKVIDGKETTVGYYDCKPTVICDMVSGDAMVYYVKAGRVTDNEFELVNPYTNDCVICYMPYSYDGVEVNGITEHWLFDFFYEGEVAGGKESEQKLIDDWGGQRFLDSPVFTGEDGETEYYQIPDFTAIAYNQQGVYSYSIDKDGSLDTDADRELFLQVYDFKKHQTKYRIQLTDDKVADALPQLFRSKMRSSGEGAEDDATDTRLFWYRGGSEVCYIDVTELLKHGIDDHGNLIPSPSEGKDECTYASPKHLTMMFDDSHAQKQMADFTVTEDDKGNMYIVWTENTGEGREIWAVGYLGDENIRNDNTAGFGWTAPYQLTHEGYVNDGLAIAVSGEDLMVVNNRYKQEMVLNSDGTINEDEGIKLSELSLTATVMEPCGAVLAEDIKVYYSEQGQETGIEVRLPEGGRSVDIRIDLINSGLTSAKGYKTTLYAVDKNGSETEIGTKVINERMNPGVRSSVLFEKYSLPADVDGLSFKAVTKELKEGTVYYDNNHEYVTDPYEVTGDYIFDNVNAYQLPDGFHLAGNVTNRGNGSATADDHITVRLNGPYNMDLKFDRDECILGQAGLDGLAPGGSMNFDIPVNITADMMKEYGYVNIAASVERDVTAEEGEDEAAAKTKRLGEVISTDVEMTMPIGFRVQSVSVDAGKNVKPVITDALGTAFGAEDIMLTIDDTDTAVISDGMIYGVKDGITTLNAIHTASGAVASAKIIVGGGIASEDIPEDDIPEGLWYTIVDENGSRCDEFTYTGKALKPEVHVYDGIHRLVNGKDYSVDYKNNTNVYTLKEGEEGFDASKAPAVEINGKGNYAETEILYFAITPVDLSKDEGVYADDMFIKHTDKELKPVPTVKYGKLKLKAGTDYDVAYYKKDTTESLASIKDAGTYDLVVTGKGNYTGSITVKAVVGDPKKIKPVSKLKVDKIAPVNYTGERLMPVIIVKDGNKVLTSNQSDSYSESGYDYSVAYYDNINAGTAYAVIKGNPDNGYAGSRKIEFKINGRSLKGAVVSGIPKEGYAFTGGAVTLNDQLLNGTVKVTAKDGTELKLYTGKGEPDDRSYTVSYKNNRKPGTAKAVFKGVGGCEDTTEVKFKIAKASLASGSAEVSIDETAPYSKAGSKAGVIVKYAGAILKEGRDYAVSYKNNKNTGDTAKAIVKGKGNYTGTYGKELRFTVTTRDMEGLEITASDVVFKDKAGIYKTKVEIKDGGKKLKAGKDYEKAVTYTYAKDVEGHKAGDPISDTEVLPAGTEILVTAKAAGSNYTGSVSTTFRIVKSDIKKVKLNGRVAAKAYTGSEVKLSEADIPLAVPATVEEGGTTVYNWKIVEGSYKNNVKKGTASVTIRGLGDYGGTRIIKFKIGTKGLKWLKKQ